MSETIELQEIAVTDRDPVTGVVSRVSVVTNTPDELNVFHGAPRIELARRALKRALASLDEMEDLR